MMHPPRENPARRFAAPWSRTLYLTTALGIAILLGVAGIMLTTLDLKGVPRLLVVGAPLTILAACGMFMVRGYSLHDGVLGIQRAFWETRISLRDLKSVTTDPGAMRSSV